MSQMRLSWERVDLHGVWTIVAVVGLGYGLYLALFGFLPVEIHLPTHRLGVMTPGCGGTRALRYTMLGQWGRAWQYNPASVVLAVGAALTLLRALLGRLTGRWLTVHIGRPRTAWGVFIVAWLALWVRQQLNAELLMGP